MKLNRTNYSSGAPLEEKVGYSRMVKAGPFVYIGGTTAVQPDGSVYGEGDPYEQTKYILAKHVELLKRAGSKKEEVIKVKVYATDMKYVTDIAKAYSEIFKEVKPLCTVVGTTMLNRPTQLVEIEMDAVIGALIE
ncbi:MAG: Rid family hydrolase [Acetobacterium sp.]